MMLVDLALSLFRAAQCILSGEDAVSGFTESEEVIQLCCDGDLVAVTSSNHSWRVAVEGEELGRVFSEFCRDAYAILTSEIPGLAANPVIRRMVPQ
ncbi:hypothetical protein AB0O01_03930 [Streptomyces sp. NPDC093252]|uniref:hypothetical protein n=1 Tax=Streptomyces sp. NPDC093252 TaxID=3154980 RepID=UPI00343B4DED